MKKIKLFQILSIIFTFIFGTILHFTYNWSAKNSVIALFSTVNESTWEHLKLLFFPMTITAIIGYFIFRKDVPIFLCSKVCGIIVAIIFTVVFFYTYTGILGKNIAFIDISSFFIAVILGEVISYLLILNKFKCNSITSIIILITLFICFMIFTCYTPQIGLFKDPITGQYGI